MMLKLKILIPTILLIAVSIIVSTVISYTSVTQTISRLSEAQLSKTAVSAGARINDRVEAILAEARKLAEEKDVQKATRYKGLRSKATAFLKAYAKDRPYYDALILTDRNGIAVAASDEAVVDTLDVSSKPYFKAAADGRVGISGAVRGKTSGIFTIGVPVAMNGKTEGCLLTVVSLDVLGDGLIRPLKSGETGFGYLVGKDGLILYHPDVKKRLVDNISSLAFGRKMLSGTPGIVAYPNRGQTFLAAFVPVKATGWTLAVAVSLKELMRPARKLGIRLILAGLISVGVLGIGIFVLIQKLVVGPVDTIRKELKGIAKGEGDLTKRLAISARDEIGSLAFWFNSFIEKLEVLVRGLKDNVVSVSDSSGNLSMLSSGMRQGAGDVADQAQGLTSDAEDMNRVMTSVAAAVEQASANIGMVSRAAGELRSSIGRISERSGQSRSVTEAAVSRSRKASDKIHSLGDASEEISRMAGVIAEISEQTNLLALNATIEAARAGAAGKGFAVVASEIKDLAGQTARATEDIEKTISAIQSSTAESVGEIIEVTRIIEEVNTLAGDIADDVERQSRTTAEIADNIVQASEGLGEVNGNIAQASDASRNIAGGAQKVSEAASEFTEISHDVETNARELADISKALDQAVKGFRVS